MMDAAPVHCGHSDYSPARQCRECLLIHLRARKDAAEKEWNYCIGRIAEINQEVDAETWKAEDEWPK